MLDEASFRQVERGQELASTLTPEHRLKPLVGHTGRHLWLFLAGRCHGCMVGGPDRSAPGYAYASASAPDDGGP